jgi:hypothetical protein
METKVIISDNLKNTIIEFVEHNAYVKLKLELVIDITNLCMFNSLTPYELFLLGKELGYVLAIQGETLKLNVSENEIAIAISEIEDLLKNLK